MIRPFSGHPVTTRTMSFWYFLKDSLQLFYLAIKIDNNIHSYHSTGSQMGAILSPKDIWQYVETFWAVTLGMGVHLASSGPGLPRMWLDILSCTWKPPNKELFSPKWQQCQGWEPLARGLIMFEISHLDINQVWIRMEEVQHPNLLSLSTKLENSSTLL